MASTSSLQYSERSPFAALPLSRFYAVSDSNAHPSSAKKSFTPGSASLKRRMSPATFASPCKKRATDGAKPSTPGGFAAPRAPRVVSKCLFEDVEMDADDSGFAGSPAMKLNYDSVPSGSGSSSSLRAPFMASPLLGGALSSQSTPSATPKTLRKPDALTLAPSPEIMSNRTPNRNAPQSASRWIASKPREPDAHHPGFDVYCDPIGYDASSLSSPMSWEDDQSVPDLVFDSPKENSAPPRRAKHMLPPMAFLKDGPSSSPLSNTPRRPSLLANSTSVDSPWARMQLGDSSPDF
ncbi:hypothetical protein BDV93DRAFT_603651 [Ceratobasidium sp. AG-I]|nr:hypothetical protein BDV93DRAFT_603651 [Ceratobasidium sp. AG-I]